MASFQPYQLRRIVTGRCCQRLEMPSRSIEGRVENHSKAAAAKHRRAAGRGYRCYRRAAAVTAAESPELIPVVAPITAKAGAVAGKKAEEEIRKRIAMQDGENDMKTCFKDGWE